MEDLLGVPHLASYPPIEITANLPPQEWQACLVSWIFSVEVRLRMTDEEFSSLKLSQIASGFPFLVTYFRHAACTRKIANFSRSSGQEAQLRHDCFLLLRRLLLGTKTPLDSSAKDLFNVTANASIALANFMAWQDTLKAVWERSTKEISDAVESAKRAIIQTLNDSDKDSMLLPLNQATALVKALPETGLIFMTGADYMEVLNATYDSRSMSTEPRSQNLLETLLKHAFLCLRSLMSNATSTASLLLDHLYDLKSHAEKLKSTSAAKATLLSNLVVSTSFLRRLDSYLSNLANKRGQELLDWLGAYREKSLHLHALPPTKRRTTKGKGKAKASTNHQMYIDKVEKVSQIKELFTDLSDAYIMRLLEYYSDSVEEVTAALLEPKLLPDHFKDSNSQIMDGGAPCLPVAAPSTKRRNAPSTNHTSLPNKKNVFDGDDFDKLRISSDRIHMGRKDLSDHGQTAEEHTRNKAAIISALAAFDSDEDERDDSYDAADVGGLVDDTVDTDERPSTSEELLYRAWIADIKIFARDSKTRLSQPRQQLKRETGMTDEQIEGWALMLSRDEILLNRLKQKYYAAATFTGKQNVISSTKWTATPSGTDDDGSAQDGGGSDGHHVGMAGIRGTRNVGTGRGGSTAGPAHLDSTQAARKRKEQGRGRGGANHNRREGRAKKFGRGMAGLA